MVASRHGSWPRRRRSSLRPDCTYRARLPAAKARGEILLFGGGTGSGLAADTWVRRGTTWSQRAVAGPSARVSHALAFDGARNQVVLFGGVGGPGVTLQDTWIWDGTAWSSRSPATSPPPRGDHVLAYDPGTQRVLLFGGHVPGSPPLGDAWEWDGTNWNLRTPAVSPSPRAGHALAHDRDRQRLLLLGGGTPGAPLDDAWEWDGNTWAAGNGGPTARANHGMVHDASRRRLVVFGGRGSGNVVHGSTWTGGAVVPAVSQMLGTACAGTRGFPRLASGLPARGNPACVVDLLDARSLSPCAFGLATATRSIPIGGGCTLYLDGTVVTVAASTNAIGFASVGLAIPADRTALGLSLFAQAVVLDPQAVLGAAFTGARRLMIGD